MMRVAQAAARKLGFDVVRNPPIHDVHPDIKVLVHAALRGEAPAALEVAGAGFCKECQAVIKAFGGELTSTSTAIFP